MTLDGKRVFIGICSGIVMTLSAQLLLVYSHFDWFLTASYLLWRKQSLLVLLAFAPLLPFFGAVWCARTAMRRPEFWTRRSFIGACLLFSALLVVSLYLIPQIVIGFLGMPRRYNSSPFPYAALAWTAVWLTPLLVGAIGLWLLGAKRR